MENKENTKTLNWYDETPLPVRNIFKVDINNAYEVFCDSSGDMKFRNRENEEIPTLLKTSERISKTKVVSSVCFFNRWCKSWYVFNCGSNWHKKPSIARKIAIFRNGITEANHGNR